MYEELNSSGILRTLWDFFLEFYVRTGIFRSFGGVLLVKILEFYVRFFIFYGIVRTFINFVRNFTYNFAIFLHFGIFLEFFSLEVS